MQFAENVDPLAEPLAFFSRAHRAFAQVLSRSLGQDDLLAVLPERAFDLFATSVACRSDDGNAVACQGGCASCCTIRVGATAPEVFAISRYIRSLPPEIEIELVRRVTAAELRTRRMGEEQRMRYGFVCPFVDRDFCVVYPVRPLACRGHASFDVRACKDALAGQARDVPITALHMTVRSLVQNAMQSALRDSGLAWGIYELNQASSIAASMDGCEAAWSRGDDVFAPATITDISLAEMAATFDAIKAHGL